MTQFRIAVTDEDDNVFQWRATFSSDEDAQAALPEAQAEYPDSPIAVQRLDPVEFDADGVPTAHAWAEV